MDHIHLELARGHLAERALRARHSGHLAAVREGQRRRAGRPRHLPQRWTFWLTAARSETS